ncbi:MAG: glycerol kinase GlpK [Planctomycetes bacterium]|nr:glycerol kinase GlpK [Planctomycetota bacterium]
MSRYILAIDAGTTGITTTLFDPEAHPAHSFYQEIAQHYPRPGWVEHDPAEIWNVTLQHLRQAADAVGPENIASIGITNQRETTILWDRTTGRPIHNAIVWQCRRTTPLCRELRERGMEKSVKEKTGLVIDPYFSATKIKWLLDNAPGARARAESGDLAFGTVDTWLLWNLTGRKSHATDFTNASRTMVFNIRKREWDGDLLSALEIPGAILPDVLPSAAEFGVTDAALVGVEIPIAGIAGDQQAALFGQSGFHPGLAKNTYGTGCFFLANTGDRFVESSAGLLTTLACGPRGEPTFALEGSVFVAGAAIQWLRDEIGFVTSAAESEDMARSVSHTEGVYMVPAFVGLGAPYWDAEARGTIVGITRGTRPAHIVRAALESIAYQTHDLITAARQDIAEPMPELRVDGGACANDHLMQFQADILNLPVNRPANIETTSLGAGFLAGLQVGLWKDPAEIEKRRRVDHIFEPAMSPADRERHLDGWRTAIRKTLA